MNELGFRSALVIGGNKYQDAHLCQLKTPESDVKALASVLGDSSIGDFHVKMLLNPLINELRRDINLHFRDRKHDDFFTSLFLRTWNSG